MPLSPLNNVNNVSLPPTNNLSNFRKVEFDEILNDEDLVENTRPGIFYYHRYLTTNKYTIDDIYNKPFGESEEENIQPFNENDLKDHMHFIKEYIQKKLTVQR